jgi:hypothetical protein
MCLKLDGTIIEPSEKVIQEEEKAAPKTPTK